MRAIFFILLFLINTTLEAKILTLADVLSSVSKHYPEIKAARNDIDKAKGELLSAKGRFDPSIDIYNRGWPVGGYENNFLENTLHVPTLANGLKLFGTYRIGRGNFPEYYQNFLTNRLGEYRVGFELPLMRNFAIDEERTALITGAQRIHLKAQEANNLKLRIYQEAIQSYWMWVQAKLSVHIYQKQLQLATDRQEAISRRVHHGDLAEVDLSENEQQIMQRRQMLQQSLLFLQESRIQLALYIRKNNGEMEDPEKFSSPSLKSLLHQGNKLFYINRKKLLEHPALRSLNDMQNITHAELELAHNALLPHLNLRAYTSKDYGQGNPLLDSQTLRFGLNFQFPLWQREAKGRVMSLGYQLNRLDNEFHMTEDKLLQQIQRIEVVQRNKYRELMWSRKEYRLAKIVEYAEKKRFDAGDSNLFMVNQREMSTQIALLKVVANVIDVHQSADLLRYFI